jgi:ribonuclease HII
VAGVDEAGRGPLAGAVIAAAVMLDPGDPIAGLADSKKLAARRREELAEAIRARALAWGVGRAEPHEIDRINILQASLLAMSRAVEALRRRPAVALIDGLHCPRLACPAVALVRGDARNASIAAASILAKVVRDAEMLELDGLYPGYGFAVHKGYPTPAHLAALARLGPSAVHRRSFTPVRNLLPDGELRGPAQPAARQPAGRHRKSP